MALSSRTDYPVTISLGNRKVTLHHTGEVVDLKTNDIINVPPKKLFNLMARHFKFLTEVFGSEMVIPLEGLPIDGNWDNPNASNVFYRFTTMVENPAVTGYYVIPNHPMRSISMQGDIIGTNNCKPYSWSPDTRGYLNNQVAINGVNLSISKHRAVMLTFSDIPDNVGFLEVNHIDGDKGNCEKHNLEWTTPKENIHHAWETGLATNNNCMLGILVRNARNGNVDCYFSQKAASEALGILEKTLEYRLKHSDFSRVWADGYQFKYMNDERDWVYPDDVEAEIQKQTAKIKMGCRIKNCITGEITVLDNVNSAYLVMGCGQRTPHNLIKQQRYSPFEGFQIVPDDGTEFPDFSDLELSNSYSCFSCYNVVTGEVYIGKSLRQLAGHLNLDPRAIEREASYGRDPYCGYLFKRGPAYGSKDFSGEH